MTFATILLSQNWEIVGSEILDAFWKMSQSHDLNS